ncbi:hypothetical protein P692DRAFT_201872678 [Suillus brevipes Sb2]|nr:hypothetical protein P692DRAFT_201872678 [Suillus brevipes Sb2]
MHCEFPPERALDPHMLTQHKVFSRAVDLIPPTMPGLPAPSAPPKILKPRGKVSRLNRGGYNLQDKLGWSPSEYEEVRSFVIHLALEHLNVQRSWKAQLTHKLKVVFSEAKSHYPVLDDYKGDWVVSDFLRGYLKNSSTRAN